MGWVCLVGYTWIHCTKAFHFLAFPSWWNTNPLQLNQHNSPCGTFCTGTCHLHILVYYLVRDKLTGKKARSGKKRCSEILKTRFATRETGTLNSILGSPAHPRLPHTMKAIGSRLYWWVECMSKQRHRNLPCSSLLSDPKRDISKLLSYLCQMQLHIYLQFPTSKCNLLYEPLYIEN